MGLSRLPQQPLSAAECKEYPGQVQRVCGEGCCLKQGVVTNERGLYMATTTVVAVTVGISTTTGGGEG